MNSFFERLRKAFSSSSLIVIIRGIEDSLHRLFNRITDYRVMFLFGFQHTFHKGLMFLFSFDKIPHEIPNFFQTLIGEIKKHFANFRDFHCLHDKMINGRGFIVNYKISSEFGENKDEGR